MDTIVGRELIHVTKRPNRILIAQLCFYIFWTIQMVSKGLGLDDSIRIYKVLSLLSLGFLGLKYLLTDWDFKELVIAACLLFSGFMTYLMTEMIPLLLAIATIVGMKDIKIRPLLTYTFYLRAMCFIIVVSAAILGLIPTINFGDREIFDPINYFFTGEWKVLASRIDLGYQNPNPAHINYLVILLLYFYVRNNKLNIAEYAGAIICNYLVYRWTGSRTSVVIVFFCIGLSLIMRIKWIKKPVYAIGVWTFFIAMAVCVVTALLYEPIVDPENPTLIQKVSDILNKLFTTRLSFNAYAIKTFPVWYPFGERFQNGWSQLDCGLLNFWLRFGFINCAIFLYSHTAYLIKCKREDRTVEFIAFVSMAILGITEMSLYSVTMNVFLVLLAVFLYPPKKRVLPSFDRVTNLL